MFTAGVVKTAVCAEGVDMYWYYEKVSDDKAVGSALTTSPHISVYLYSCLHSASVIKIRWFSSKSTGLT